MNLKRGKCVMHSVNELVSDLVNYHQIKEAYP